LGLAFFGLTFDLAPQTRSAIFTQIHQIVFHGKGGYDWHTVYNMPIWLRRFTFSEIEKFYNKEQESTENSSSSKQTVTGSDGKIKAPEFLKNSQQNKKPAKYN